ncbi:hypothetical protein KDK77_07645, partial [bacterium]|nr:hypothetical protein [bacterium]
TAEEAQEFSEPFKVSATVPIGSSSVPEPDFFDEAPPVSPQKEAVAERKSQSSVLDDYIKLLHTTARKSTTVERFNRNTPHDNLLTFIYAVLEQIKAYVSLKDPNQRMHMIRAYTQGTREQKIAAQIMRRTRKGTKTRFVNEIINYISYSDLADDFTVDTLTNNEVRELVKTEVLQRRLAQLLADVIMYVDVFGEEDIPHRMKLWRDYSLPDASPEQKIAAYIISKILEQQGSEYNITGKSFNDRKQALIHAVHYITGEKDLREQYDAVIRHTPVSEIVDLVTLELHNRRTELITEIQQKAPVIHGEKSSFNRSGRSLYELWGIVSLLKEYGVNDDLLPLALHGFSFKQLRNVLFGLRDAGVPITEQTLRMNLSLEGMPPQNSPVAPSDAERLDEEKQPTPPKPFMQFHHVFDWAA